MPGSDDSVVTVARAGSALAGSYDLLLPPAEVVELLLDKRRFLEHSRSVGLPVPSFAVIHERADAVDAGNSLRFPCVIKPAYKTVRWQNGTPAKGFRVSDPAALVSIYDEYSELEPVMIVQEWVAGDDSQLFSCNAVFDRDSVPICTFVARKIRQWPPETGYSSLGEECRNDVVIDLMNQALRPLQYQGLAYLEVKQDSRTGEHLIIEPNVGRPTRRSPIAELGGVELHYAAYALAARLPLPGSLQQQYKGAKWIHLRGDLPAAVRECYLRKLSLRGYLQSIRGVRSDAVLSLRDPGPAVEEIVGASEMLRRRLARIRRRAGARRRERR